MANDQDPQTLEQSVIDNGNETCDVITKREFMSAIILAGILSRPEMSGRGQVTTAIATTTELLMQLENTKKN